MIQCCDSLFWALSSSSELEPLVRLQKCQVIWRITSWLTIVLIILLVLPLGWSGGVLWGRFLQVCLMSLGASSVH